MEGEQRYIDFDQYIRQGEPDKQTMIFLPGIPGISAMPLCVMSIRIAVGVAPEPKYLERFFRNMMLGEQWVLKSRYLYLNPAIESGFVRMLYSESPHHPRQKYLLTAKGAGLYNILIKGT